MAGMGKRREAAFAFRTLGDVLPVAVVVAALARADPSSSITFVTHEAHRNMETHLVRSGAARFLAVSAPPVVPGRAVVAEEDEIAHLTGAGADDGEVKAALEMQLREECIAAMDSAMGDSGDGYISVMNSIFSAQRNGIPIDACFIGSQHSAFLEQEVPLTPGQPKKEPMLLPLAVGLLDSQGRDMRLTSVKDGASLHNLTSADGDFTTTAGLHVDKAEQEFTFVDIAEKPVPSLLRNFSAPVRLVSDVTNDDLFFLLAHDSDQFNRWEGGQTLSRRSCKQ